VSRARSHRVNSWLQILHERMRAPDATSIWFPVSPLDDYALSGDEELLT